MTNQIKRSAIAQLIRTMGKYYSKPIDQDLLSMMVDDLEDLEQEDVVQAFSKYRKDPKNKFFPMPSQIREIAKPEMTMLAQARDIPERIKSAIRIFGYPQAAKAREYIGPEGWAIVQQNGGWNSICCDPHNNLFGDSARYAQIRDRANDLLQYGDDFGNENGFLELPHEEEHRGLMRMGDLVKIKEIK